MKDKELDLDILENADRMTVEHIAKKYKAVSDKDKQRILERSEKLYRERSSDDTVSSVVSGVEIYHRPVWRKLVAAASAIVIVSGAAAGGAFMLKKRMTKPADTLTETADDVTAEEATEVSETTEEVTEETEANEETHQFKELQLHEPAPYVNSLKEAEALIDAHSITMKWDERHDYRVDTAYYTELLQSEGYDLDSLEAKSYIYHMMLNSFMYFDTAKGTMIDLCPDNDSYRTEIEFQDDFSAQESYTKTTMVSGEDRIISEHFVYDNNDIYKYDNEKTYEVCQGGFQSEVKVPEDNYRYVEAPPPDHSQGVYMNNSFMGMEFNEIQPDQTAIGWLRKFDNWKINSISERLGRAAAELSGVNDRGNEFTISVDICTGIIMAFTESENGIVRNQTELTALEVDVPIDRIEFDPSGCTEKKLYSGSEIR